MRAVDGRVEDAEPARARARHGLEAERPVRVAELLRGGRERLAPLDALPGGHRHAGLAEPAVALGLVVREPHRLGAADEELEARVGELLARGGEPGQVVGGLGEDGVHALALRESSTASANAGSAPGGTVSNASHRKRPAANSLMSQPTSRTSRSPFARSPRRRAAVPGAPDAVTRTVNGSTGASIAAGPRATMPPDEGSDRLALLPAGGRAGRAAAAEVRPAPRPARVRGARPRPRRPEVDPPGCLARRARGRRRPPRPQPRPAGARPARGTTAATDSTACAAARRWPAAACSCRTQACSGT